MATPTTSSQTTTIKPRVKRGSEPYTYHIESKTRPGTFHVADTHRLTCSCEAGRNRRGCWHLRLALAWHDWRVRQHAQHSLAAAARPTGMAALQDAVA